MWWFIFEILEFCVLFLMGEMMVVDVCLLFLIMEVGLFVGFFVGLIGSFVGLLMLVFVFIVSCLLCEFVEVVVMFDLDGVLCVLLSVVVFLLEIWWLMEVYNILYGCVVVFLWNCMELVGGILYDVWIFVI